jgi:nucleoside transporter
MDKGTRIKLSIMMFLQYAFNGIWIIPLATYLSFVGYSADNIGNVYGTFALGGIIAPFFIGMFADRFFQAQKLLATLNIVAGILLIFAAKASVGPDGLAVKNASGEPVLGVFYWLLLAHFICYMPTWALTNSIAFRQMKNTAKEFPAVRVMGTFGWITVSAVTLFSDQINAALGNSIPFEQSVIPLYFGAAIGIAAGLFAFALPQTLPEGKGDEASIGDILGLKALRLFKDKNFAIFAVSSFLIFFPAMFYWAFANMYLNEFPSMKGAAFWQSTGQMMEVVFLVIMPFFFVRLGVKKMLLIGMFAWIARFVCFSYGDWETSAWIIVLIGLILHGPCFDFFFVTGQLYTDQKADKSIQSQAQGLNSFITFGLGWFLGSKVAGLVVDHYAIAIGDGVGHDWHTIWLIPIGMTAALIAFFMLFFKDKTLIGHD